MAGCFVSIVTGDMMARRKIIRFLTAILVDCVAKRRGRSQIVSSIKLSLACRTDISFVRLSGERNSRAILTPHARLALCTCISRLPEKGICCTFSHGFAHVFCARIVLSILTFLIETTTWYFEFFFY